MLLCHYSTLGPKCSKVAEANANLFFKGLIVGAWSDSSVQTCHFIVWLSLSQPHAPKPCEQQVLFYAVGPLDSGSLTMVELTASADSSECFALGLPLGLARPLAPTEKGPFQSNWLLTNPSPPGPSSPAPSGCCSPASACRSRWTAGCSVPSEWHSLQWTCSEQTASPVHQRSHHGDSRSAAKQNTPVSAQKTPQY